MQVSFDKKMRLVENKGEVKILLTENNKGKFNIKMQVKSPLWKAKVIEDIIAAHSGWPIK